MGEKPRRWKKSTKLIRAWSASLPPNYCLQCDEPFQPLDKRANRICDECKKHPLWKLGLKDHSL